MTGIVLGALLLIWLISRYDKWDVTKNPKSDISLDEIEDMFKDD